MYRQHVLRIGHDNMISGHLGIKKTTDRIIAVFYWPGKIDTETVADALLDIFSRVGLPNEMLTDLGKQFVSDLMKEICRLLDIKKLTTTPYHPQCNGLVERFNGFLKSTLKKMCEDQPREWDRYIPALLFAYRDSEQESLGFSPFELIYGRTVRGPLTVLKEIWTSETGDTETKTTLQYVKDLRARLDGTMRLAQENLKKASARYRTYANKGKKMRSFVVADKVLLLLPTDNNKLLMQWKGPIEIKEKVNDRNYIIEINGNLKKYHANMLKKFVKRGEFGQKVSEETSETHVNDLQALVVDDSHVERENQSSSREVGVELPELEPHEGIEHVNINPDLHETEKQMLRRLFTEYSDVLTDVPGNTKILAHKIVLTSNTPIRTKAYPVPHAMKAEIKTEVGKMLEAGIIEKSNSAYASRVVLVKKKDANYRFCDDYRKINGITKFDAQPIGNPDAMFQKMQKGRYFSKMDLAKGYWQIPMSEDSQQYTAFITEFGMFQFKRMPFGLVNSGATFTKMMHHVLKGLPTTDSFVDDIITHSKDFEGHLRDVRKVLERLHDSTLTIKPSKCMLGYTHMEFIGHELGEDATTKGKPNKVEWDESMEKAFTTMIAILSKSPVLRLPDFNKDFILRTDASNTGIGAILLQEHEGSKFPVMYASRKLNAVSATRVDRDAPQRGCSGKCWTPPEDRGSGEGNLCRSKQETLDAARGPKVRREPSMSRWGGHIGRHQRVEDLV
ncbi:uncharacterized protein LOC127859731 [Dreissena polymorpha]|uniref:uncharacterized protein LOC127859731 n=1 Tax=Dreissena polymorpha TaxID=45954 RepID=UPI00226519F5|nr:uncharacterized protein LOC127859731 [Dreissena polymorpha]